MADAKTASKGDAKQQQAKPKRKPDQAPAAHPIEWVFAVVSAIVVLAMLGYTLFEAIAGTGKRPELSVAVSDIRPSGARYTVGFTLHNGGDDTAAAVEVEGQLTTPDGAVESSSAQFDYAPGHADQHGGLLFDHDPSTGTLRLTAQGYRKP